MKHREPENTVRLTVMETVTKMFKNIMEKNKISRGFTLVELITVIGILGILSVALLTVLNPLEQFKKANDSKRKSDLSQIQKALETYYQDNNRYPASILWGESWSPYMNVAPEDPKPNYTYVYWTSADGQTYYIYASLERGSKDPQACNSGNACTSLSGNGISPTACGATCNYGVSTPNVSP